MKRTVLKLIEKFGYTVRKNVDIKSLYHDIREPEFWEIYDLCKPYTMTSLERMYALYSSVNYILSVNIKGAFAECGVWRGGSAMLITKMLSNRNITDRKIYLYDTFEGMAAATKSDIDFRGREASRLLKENPDNKDKGTSVWCLADLSDVKNNMSLTNYPEENIVYIKGKVENTIPGSIPDGNIALLRLDTDWYESTKHELNYLFPLLAKNGIIIIDDYGHWDGCRKAVDEYLSETHTDMLLSRIDYSCRLGVKNSL